METQAWKNNESERETELNAQLSALYAENTAAFLAAWSAAFGETETAPCRINTFGIIDPNRYHAEPGILFVGRETNGWSNRDYEQGLLFRDWLRDISQSGLQGKGHVTRHPNLWYNLGRWTLLLQNPRRSIEELTSLKAEALSALGSIAFTNINKVRGYHKSGREYAALADSSIAKALIQQELAILQPAIVVACGTGPWLASVLPDYRGKLLFMPHPAARKNSKVMLEQLKSQLE